MKLILILEERFNNNMHRHQGVAWEAVREKITKNSKLLETLQQMEESGGEIDVVVFSDNQLGYCDCSKESPILRRSLCYDRESEQNRNKKNVYPKGNVIDMAQLMGIELLTEEQYFELQAIEDFDIKTSSWLKTDSEIREKGGAIFGDKRFGRTFVYHNGADSFYSSRGFRGVVFINLAR